MRSSQGSLCHTIGWEAWCWWQVGGRSHGHGGAATLQHIWPPQCFLVGMAFTTCELQIQGEPLSSLGECPPRREERTPEVREEERAREGAKQVGLQVSQEKDPRQGDWKLYLSHLQM